MFGRKKDAAKISDKTPVFHVRYIGCTETFVATGTGCSYVPVQRLWDNSFAEKNMRKVAIHINTSGLKLHDEKSTDTQQQPHPQPGQHYKQFHIENISFCNVDRAVNERIFSWIYRNEQHNRLDCHAVLCSTRQKPRQWPLCCLGLSRSHTRTGELTTGTTLSLLHLLLLVRL